MAARYSSTMVSVSSTIVVSRDAQAAENAAAVEELGLIAAENAGGDLAIQVVVGAGVRIERSRTSATR